MPVPEPGSLEERVQALMVQGYQKVYETAFAAGKEEGLVEGREEGRAEVLAIVGASLGHFPDPAPNTDAVVRSIKVTSLDLSERPRNCLLRANLDTIGKVVDFHNQHLNRGGLFLVDQFGVKSFDELNRALDQYKIALDDPLARSN